MKNQIARKTRSMINYTKESSLFILFFMGIILINNCIVVCIFSEEYDIAACFFAIGYFCVISAKFIERMK